MATIKTLLAMSADQLEAMSEEEMAAYCAPFLRIAPPKVKEPKASTVVDATEAGERATKRAASSKKSGDKWLAEAARLIKQHNIEGIELPKELK